MNTILGVHTGGPGGRRLGESGHSITEYMRFKDLVEKLLCYDPAKRIRPIQALNHPFLTGDDNSPLHPINSVDSLKPFDLPTKKHPQTSEIGVQVEISMEDS